MFIQPLFPLLPPFQDVLPVLQLPILSRAPSSLEPDHRRNQFTPRRVDVGVYSNAGW